jgi:ArsR family transcriptional regulator
MDLLQLFKGLSDPVRLRIAHLLTQRDELCVCHLTEALSLPQSTVSRHLNTLRNSGLVKAERRGKWVYYRMLNSNAHVEAISDLVRSSAVSDEQLKRDLANLKESVC